MPPGAAGFNSFPTALQPAFQDNMLDRAFQDQLEALCVIRRSAYRKPMPIRSGETYIYSRAGELVPVIDDLDPTSNTVPDNGLSGIGGVGASNPTYTLEQYAMKIGMTAYALDLNIYQEKQTMASTFKQNVTNLGRQAALSLDLKCLRAALQGYEGGRTYATGSSTSGNTVLAVDNLYGLDTAYSQITIGGNGYSYGRPNAVSGSNKLKAFHIAAATGVVTAINISAVAKDVTNTSTLVTPSTPDIGHSGTITYDPATAAVIGDIIVAADAPNYVRPKGARSRYEMDETCTAQIQLIINTVAQFRLNSLSGPLADGSYPCYIDAIMDAQFFTDPQFQILTMGAVESKIFKGARMLPNYNVTFIPTTNLPVCAFTNKDGKALFARRAIVCAERWIQEGPFAGAADVIAEGGGGAIHDVRMVDDIAIVHRDAVDRLGQIISQGWFYIGGFVIPTDVTINNTVIPSATAARYKRATVIEVCSTI